jgi:hypothetical protein
MSITAVHADWQELEVHVPVVPRHLCLARGALQAYTGIEHETIHCISGRIWVTFEGEPTDNILMAGEYMEVPNAGKVLVSGPGCFQISRGIDECEVEAS